MRCGHAVRMKRLQRVEFLAHAHELQRLIGNGADRERRAATGVAIHFRKNHSGDSKPLVELLGGFHRVLPGHGVGHE